MALEDSKTVKQKLESANDILILLMNNPSLDAMASGLALFNSLKETDKNITIASIANINTAGWNLPGSAEISQKIGNRNLVISLAVKNRDSVDKVSYNLEEDGKTFNLIIQPKKGQKPLTSDQVAYSYSGATADLIFLIDTYNFQELGGLYENERKLYDEADTVAITHSQIKSFANIHLFDNTQSCLSEVIADLIPMFGLKINKDAATNILAGIDIATNHLQSASVSAKTFQSIASLMNVGGVRQSKPSQPQPTSVASQESTINKKDNQQNDSKQSVPQDWLSPKIYKGTSTK